MQQGLALVGNIITEKRCVAPFHLINELGLLDALITCLQDIKQVPGLCEFLTSDRLLQWVISRLSELPWCGFTEKQKSLVVRIHLEALELIAGDASLLLSAATVIEKGVETESNGNLFESLFVHGLRTLRRTIQTS
jgi:hypothetical protein